VVGGSWAMGNRAPPLNKKKIHNNSVASSTPDDHNLFNHECCLAFYWPEVENILTAWHSIGQKWRIFLLPGILLARSGEYSYCLAFYWPEVENILTVWHSIGQK
jgi:hypothetical protein